MSAVILQNEIVHYEVLGRGRPIIFLHGWVGSWRYWISSMQAVSVSYRAYALDFWGFGDTAKNSYSYTLEGQVRLLDEFLQEMGIGKIALVGHGLGSIVALQYASRFPQFVDRVMAVGLPEAVSRLNPKLEAAGPEELSEWLLNHHAPSEAVRLEIPKTDRQAIQASLLDLRSTDLSSLLRNLPTSCLLVYGQDDPLVTPIPSLEELTLPGNIHQMILEEAGHFPMLDEPNKFNRLMTEFLNLPSGETPRQLQLKEEWKRRVR